MSEIDKIILNGTEHDVGGSGSGLTEDIKQALLQIASKVVYIDDDGQDYYDDLEEALYPPVNLVSISAVYTQSGTVYTTDSLDSLKTDLVVTALYNDQTSDTVTTYTLSGTLTAGTSTITVTYGGKTTTFTVTVTEFTTSPVLEYLDSDIKSGGSIGSNTTGYKAVTQEYAVDTVSSSARHLVIAMFFPWYYTGSGSGYQKNSYACYQNGQDSAQGNGESYNCSSTYGLDSNDDLQTLATRETTLKADTERIRFTLPYVADYSNIYQQNAKEYCYAYIKESGYILFAGSETPYYGKRYITD